MIYPIDIYDNVSNRKKLSTADKSQIVVGLFLAGNFFLFLVLHRVICMMFGAPLFVCILVQLLVFGVVGSLVFRFFIFDEEAKMREYTDEASDSFARFVHLRKDSTHEVSVNSAEHVNVFEYDSGCCVCTMRFKFGSNDSLKSSETRKCFNEIYRILVNNGMEFRTVVTPENFKQSRELDNFVDSINRIEDKQLAKHILAMSNAILQQSYEECNVDQFYLSFRTASSYQLEDLEAVIRRIIGVLRERATSFRSVEFLDLAQLIDFYREFYSVEAIDLAMMRAVALSESIDNSFKEVARIFRLQGDNGKWYQTDVEMSDLLVSGERIIEREP